MIKIDPYLINGQHQVTVVVVGAGGTGSLVVTKLARLHQALLQLDHPGLYVTVIDPDIVEEHNVGRQLFTSPDIGSYKADVLVTKINHAFSLDWDCENKKFRSEDAKTNIVFGCVDNVPARKKILKEFYHKSNSRDFEKKFFLIDCGNARDYGQVILSDYEGTLRNINDIIPDWHLQDTEELQGQGCGYMERMMEQDLFINDWVSLHAVNLIKELFFRKHLNYQGVFFDASQGTNNKLEIVKNGSKKRNSKRAKKQKI